MKKLLSLLIIVTVSFPGIINSQSYSDNFIGPLPYGAQRDGGRVDTLKEVIELIFSYFNIAIYLIIALATIFFIWNVYRYFIADKDSTSKAEAGKYVLYSIIGFFVILSFWGLVNIVIKTLNLNDSQPNIPTIKSPF